MKEEIEKIAEEFAEIFKKMNWQWNTSEFKGIPTKEMIEKHIKEDIEIIKDGTHGSHTCSGRIFVLKTISKEPEGDYIEYIISLLDRRIGEESF